MDVLGQPPSMNVKANLVGEMNEEPMELANFFIRLPLLVTSFLKPLQPTFRFKQEWDSPDLEAAADVHSTADWMRSKDSLAALTLDGTMSTQSRYTELIRLCIQHK
ncbi:unnamed protein product [Durusdinium trenchii]|uniref:Uncharacterized protein n=1 Tax=Durusdinium trenchii TaxID=1381693 RepID=A0ABP0T1W2_9DINO